MKYPVSLEAYDEEKLTSATILMSEGLVWSAWSGSTNARLRECVRSVFNRYAQLPPRASFTNRKFLVLMEMYISFADMNLASSFQSSLLLTNYMKGILRNILIDMCVALDERDGKAANQTFFG
jgi:hypothetical protein